jgi:hypothetical protein
MHNMAPQITKRIEVENFMVMILIDLPGSALAATGECVEKCLLNVSLKKQ